jgi:hypothetical protein
MLLKSPYYPTGTTTGAEDFLLYIYNILEGKKTPPNQLTSTVGVIFISSTPSSKEKPSISYKYDTVHQA